MRIIHRGELPDSRPKRCTCTRCATLFEFHPNEAMASADQRDGHQRYIPCPVCRAWCWEPQWREVSS